MVRERSFTVPKNEIGIRELNELADESKNLEILSISNTEFSDLCNQGVFLEINKRYSLLIDEFECEDIPSKYCLGCLDILRAKNISETTSFSRALKLAMNYGTFVECDF